MALEFFDGIKNFDLNKTIDSISNIAGRLLKASAVLVTAKVITRLFSKD